MFCLLFLFVTADVKEKKNELKESKENGLYCGKENKRMSTVHKELIDSTAAVWQFSISISLPPEVLNSCHSLRSFQAQSVFFLHGLLGGWNTEWGAGRARGNWLHFKNTDDRCPWERMGTDHKTAWASVAAWAEVET